MLHYTIHYDNRDGNSWTVYNSETMEPVVLTEFHPLNHQLFHKDVFQLDSSNSGLQILHSPTQSDENIAAVLVLADGKTYGRENTGNTRRKGGRLLYKCVPDNPKLPAFLVPYENKQCAGFSKVLSNLYVTIRFKQWSVENKHPIGNLSQVIGPVNSDDPALFYEYQLYCKHLHISLQAFHKKAKEAICEIKDLPLEDRTGAFTVDPAGSLDFDDAFSVRSFPDKGQTLVSVYIANVPLCIDQWQLWDSFSQRVSTIYLPTCKKPMLPVLLSDDLCSLVQNTERLAFAMDVLVDDASGQLVSITYANVRLKVFRNFVYEEEALLVSPEYALLLQTTRQLSAQHPYLEGEGRITDSHEVVAYWMIFMNDHCSRDFCQHFGNGLFRRTVPISSSSLDRCPVEVAQYVKKCSAHYVNLEHLTQIKKETNLRHEALNLDTYVHITSPIRRLVDLLNLLKFQQNHAMYAFSPEATRFYEHWTNKMDVINDQMKRIQKVQNKCLLFDLCLRSSSSSSSEKVYEGYCFEKVKSKMPCIFEYKVFLPELKLSCNLKTEKENLDDYTRRQFKILLFHDEDTFRKKINVQLL